MNEWKESLVRYFAQGEAKQSLPRLGIEVEHFILDPADRSAPYSGAAGVRQILTRLMERYPGAEALPDDDFFGFRVPGFTVTLEPAAQLEISIAPLESVGEIGRVYGAFRNELEAVLAPMGYRAVNLGCQPVSRVEELEQIPKRRYELMLAHFRETGTGGIQMMRGTASLQVSVDYTSREDFRRKLQAAYYYGPVLKLLCDNAPAFQGEKLDTRLKRTDIWRRTDPARCGILPGIFSPDYGYEDYADFLGRMPPIFLKRGDEVLPTGFRSVRELFPDRELTREEIVHVLSLAFPDVRVKQYLEIRVADSVPPPFLQAYCAMVKGLLYGKASLDRVQAEIRSMGEGDVRLAEEELMARGWSGSVYGRPVSRLAEELLDLAAEGLPPEEQPWLRPFREVVRYGGIRYIPGAEDQLRGA